LNMVICQGQNNISVTELPVYKGMEIFPGEILTVAQCQIVRKKLDLHLCVIRAIYKLSVLSKFFPL